MKSGKPPRMQALFDGAAGGGLFELPRVAPAQTGAADIVVLVVAQAARQSPEG